MNHPVKKLRTFLMSKAPFINLPMLTLFCRAAWASIWCTNYLESLQCQQFVMNCKDSLKKADLEAKNQVDAKEEEERIRQNGFIYFSFDNCQYLKRKRRYAGGQKKP